jgi:predicted nucleic acid-binding protein
MIYLIDSNVYVRGSRELVFGESLRSFHQRNLPNLVLSAVVVHELLVGAVATTVERSFRRGIIEPFRLRHRLHVPARQTWDLATKIDRRLRRHKNLESKLRTRSFFNDMLIAASAREIGAIIVTENGQDFRIIAVPSISAMSSRGRRSGRRCLERLTNPKSTCPLALFTPPREVSDRTIKG